ncbi:MAG: hypothetical protein JWM40_1108 [Frankiales bacterium]|nr:hypothetical protein [Frankiales bacterium]
MQSRLFPRRKLLASLALLGSLTFVGFAPADVARADDVSTAQARVDQLQELAASTTKTLVAGTERWQADLVALRKVRQQLTSSRRKVSAAQQVKATESARLDRMTRQLYMTPLPGQLQLALTKGPADFTQAVQVLASVDVAAASSTEIMRRASVARIQLLREQRTMLQLAQQASALEQASGKRLRTLQALAQSTSDQLLAAQNALQRARGIAAARAAARAQAAERTRLARLASMAGGPMCTGKPVTGQQNGNLDPASLCPLWMGGGATAKGTAAAAFNKMSKYHAATVGSPLCVTGGYRSYQRQVELYREKPGLAAVPGTSEHGWGNAIDFCGGVQDSGSAASAWMRRNAGSFGWFHPSWAEPSGSKPEPWHWEFNG